MEKTEQTQLHMDESKPRLEMNERVGIVEAILFVTGNAVEKKEICRALDLTDAELEETLDALESGYDFDRRGLRLLRFGAHFLFNTEMTGQAEEGFPQAAFEFRIVVKTNHNVTNDRHIVKKTNVLERTGNAFLVDLFLRKPIQFFPVKIERTGGRLIYTGEKIEYRGLAGTIRTDQTVDLILFDAEVNILSSLETAKGNTHILRFKNIL
jgi:hypothetical protein